MAFVSLVWPVSPLRVSFAQDILYYRLMYETCGSCIVQVLRQVLLCGTRLSQCEEVDLCAILLSINSETSAPITRLQPEQIHTTHWFWNIFSPRIPKVTAYFNHDAYHGRACRHCLIYSSSLCCTACSPYEHSSSSG